MKKLLISVSLILTTIFILGFSNLSTTVLNGYVGNDLVPSLPDIPFDYENQNFPLHLEETEWGFNDSTILDMVTDNGATLGRVLFFDEKLSANENLSCATCHKQELSFADDTPFSMGVTENTGRNSMQLNDLGWSNRTNFFWDLSESDLTDMISLPLRNENEIGVTDIDALIEKLEETDYYPDLFEESFGDPLITEQRINEAIAQFISSMVTFNSKFDRSHTEPGLLTESEIRGSELFSLNCSICHTDGNSFFLFGGFMDLPFIFNNGLSETNDLGAGEWMGEEFDHLFKVPTLRNIELTAPYMHDGRFESLEEVIDHYSEDLEPNEWTGEFIPADGFNYTDQQKTDLINFLKTFTDLSFTEDEKWSDPFASTTSSEEVLEVINSVNIFPNPTSDYAIIEMINPSSVMIELTVLDMSGRFIKKMSSHNEQVILDVTGFNKGNYIIELRSGSQRQSELITVL